MNNYQTRNSVEAAWFMYCGYEIKEIKTTNEDFGKPTKYFVFEPDAAFKEIKDDFAFGKKVPVAPKKLLEAYKEIITMCKS
jgi:FPC/CPF motif-containing protein YcgG